LHPSTKRETISQPISGLAWFQRCGVTLLPSMVSASSKRLMHRLADVAQAFGSGNLDDRSPDAVRRIAPSQQVRR
jgi:hypothetical protein